MALLPGNLPDTHSAIIEHGASHFPSDSNWPISSVGPLTAPGTKLSHSRSWEIFQHQSGREKGKPSGVSWSVKPYRLVVRTERRWDRRPKRPSTGQDEDQHKRCPEHPNARAAGDLRVPGELSAGVAERRNWPSMCAPVLTAWLLRHLACSSFWLSSSWRSAIVPLGFPDLGCLAPSAAFSRFGRGHAPNT